MNEQTPAIPDPRAFQKPYFFFAVDPNATFTYVSPSVEQILGYSSIDLIGSTMATLVASENKNLDESFSCAADWDTPSECEDSLMVAKAKDGTSRALRIQIQSKRNAIGQLVVRHGLAQDVTESYFVEQELRGRLADLEQRESGLTDREREVLELVISGRLNKSIAKQLAITQRAVERIRARLMQKFQADTSAELVSMATEFKVLNGIVVDRRRPSAIFSAARVPRKSGANTMSNHESV